MRPKNEQFYINFSDRSRRGGPTKVLDMIIACNHIQVPHPGMDTQYTIPIQCGACIHPSIVKLIKPSFTTAQVIENALLHTIIKTKFKTLLITRGRYIFNFSEFDCSSLSRLISYIYSYDGPRMNYTWIKPLQDLYIQREEVENKHKLKGKSKNIPDIEEYGGDDDDMMPYVPQYKRGFIKRRVGENTLKPKLGLASTVGSNTSFGFGQELQAAVYALDTEGRPVNKITEVQQLPYTPKPTPTFSTRNNVVSNIAEDLWSGLPGEGENINPFPTKLTPKHNTQLTYGGLDMHTKSILSVKPSTAENLWWYNIEHKSVEGPEVDF